MAGHRRDRQGFWREWLLSALLGVGLALVCILLLNRLRAAPAPAREETARPRRELGVEFTFGFRLLLPED